MFWVEAKNKAKNILLKIYPYIFGFPSLLNNMGKKKNNLLRTKGN